MRKQRILVICQHYWPESFRITDICEGFVDRGYDVEVLCGQPNYPKGEWFPGYGPFKQRKQVHNGVKIRRTFEIKRGNNSNIRIFLNYISYPIASLFHIPYLCRQKYDKIFIYELSPVMMAISGILLGKIKHIETTMYVLDMWPQNLYSIVDIKSKFWRDVAERVSMWHYKNVDKIITVSSRMKDFYLDVLDISENRICFIPQCCEKIYEQEIPDSILAKKYEKGFNIVFTGNISPAQSFETIIGTADLIHNQGIRDINWIIVGDGMTRKWLEEEVKSHGLEESFFFEGWKPMGDIPRYTYIADGLIACLAQSDLQDFYIPAKVMSYFAAGRPIILAMDGEVQDIVKDAKCGLTCNSGDQAQLADNIMKLYQMSKEERIQMGRNAKEYHKKHFDRDKNIDKMLRFIMNA